MAHADAMTRKSATLRKRQPNQAHIVQKRRQCRRLEKKRKGGQKHCEVKSGFRNQGKTRRASVLRSEAQWTASQCARLEASFVDFGTGTGEGNSSIGDHRMARKRPERGRPRAKLGDGEKTRGLGRSTCFLTVLEKERGGESLIRRRRLVNTTNQGKEVAVGYG